MNFTEKACLNFFQAPDDCILYVLSNFETREKPFYI